MTSEQRDDGLECMLRNAARLHRETADERDRLKAELAAVRSDRTIDNGDGTVTRLLPVTHAVGFDVIGVRVPRAGDSYISFSDGEVRTASHDHGRADGTNARLIVRSSPAAAATAPVTWEAPLDDGLWQARGAGVMHQSGEAASLYLSWSRGACKIRGLSRPAQLGTYRFVDGVGTLIEEQK